MTQTEILQNFIDVVNKDLDAARLQFKETITEIQKKYGFSEYGLTVAKDACLNFSYEEIRELANGGGPCKYEIEPVMIDSIKNSDDTIRLKKIEA